MKTLLLTSLQLVLICFYTHAQSSLSIKYHCIYNLADTREKEAELIVSGTKSIFKYINSSDNPRIESSERDDNGTRVLSLNVTVTDSIGTRFYSDLKENHIISREILFHEGKNQAFIVKEEIEAIQWSIQNEQKKIGRFSCQKAVGKFRGRTYTAWFTPEVPVYLGPWKLHGLPGLLVEAFDESKAFVVQIKSISPYVASANQIAPPTNGEEVSFSQFFRLIQNLGADLSKFMQAKLPRGATFEVTSVTRNTLELTESTNK
jgi:GLPGLI family protein